MRSNLDAAALFNAPAQIDPATPFFFAQKMALFFLIFLII